MMTSPPEALSPFFDRLEDRESSLVTVDPSVPDPVQRLLEQTFADQSVTVADLERELGADDEVWLVEEGEVVARSSIDALSEAILLINSDAFKTGDGEFEDLLVPDVLAELHETPFTVRGYPASDKEKLLLIIVSRLIERRAVEVDDGTLRVTFQALSRLRDERGTGTVYRRLTETDVSLHLYGVGDEPVPEEIDATVHTGTSRYYRDSWCVVFRPPEDRSVDPGPAGDGPVALVATELESNYWLGAWTYDPSLVEVAERYLLDYL